MIRRRTISGRTASRKNGERGVVILLVAIVLLFVVGAMAVLAIDLVSFYTARSEAQLAADGAALAGARVLANAGVTSNPSDVPLATNATILARTIATQVAISNKVGGRNLIASEVAITVQSSAIGGVGGLGSNPRVRVQVTRSDLPTFFARIWGTTQLTLKASAVAETYNPSGGAGGRPAVAPACVKPWLLPNINPTGNTPTIFDQNTGTIQDPSLVGLDVVPPLDARCQIGCAGYPVLNAWRFYPGSSGSFPAPSLALPSCGIPLNAYQNSIAGCVTTPISCNNTAVQIDIVPDSNRRLQTAQAVNCLTHSVNDKGDSVDRSASPPIQFLIGDDNPNVNARGQDALVSDSLVTVPVIDTSTWPPSNPPNVKVVGFVQLFLNRDGTHTPVPPEPNVGHINTTIVNLVGCGTNATGTPILGNGASPVAVRLITPPTT